MAKKYSYWLDSGKYSMLQKLSMVLFGLFTFMLLARIFTPENFGIWGLFIIISSIVEMLRHALVKNGYILFINTCEEKDKPGVEYAAVLTNCIFSIVLAIFFFFIGRVFEALFHAPGIAVVLKYYSITLLFLVPFTQREFFLIARMNFKGIFYMYFLRNGIFMCVAAFFYFSGYKVELGTLALYYGASAVCGVLIGFFIGSKYSKMDIAWDRKVFVKFLNYGKFILGTNFFALVFRNTDSFMTTRFISPIALSYYNSAARIINFAEMPVLVFSETMLPRAAHIMKSGNISEMKNIYEKTVAATLTLIIPFIIITSFFAKEIVLILAGKQYVDASMVLQVMVFYSLFLPFTSQFGNIMDATRRPQINFLVMMIFSVVNIFSNIFFISQFGLLGAAYGTLVSYVLLFITTQIILIKLVNINQMNIVRNIFTLYPDYYRIIKGSLSKYLRFT